MIEIIDEPSNIQGSITTEPTNLVGTLNTVVGGTTNYNELTNKPKINNVELVDNKTLSDLGVQPEGNYANTRVTNTEIDDLFR